MKKLLYTCAAGILLSVFSCNSQTDTQKKANEISSTLDEQSAAEEKPDLNGAWLKATINGKKWEATKIGPFYGPESNYKLVSGATEDININFQIHKPTTGLKREFNNENMANFTIDADFFSGRKGEMNVTKADGQWIEGTFYFTATSTYTSKTYEVTNGSFRIPEIKQ